MRVSRFCLIGVLAAGTTVAAIPAFAQTVVTPTNANGWQFADGAGPGTDPAQITGAKPFNGNGSIQFTVSAGNQQPLAYYMFNTPVALGTLNALTLGYSFLVPDGTVPATSPTIRLLLTGITNGGQSGGRTDGSLGWYLDGSSNAWNTQSFNLNSGNFFFRIGGVGQASDDCKTANTSGSFDDRRQTINAFKTACTGTNGTANINSALIYGVEVDFGTFSAPAPASVYADGVNFSVGSNSGNFNFELGSTSVVPEPASFALIGFGMVAVGVVSRKRKNVL